MNLNRINIILMLAILISLDHSTPILASSAKSNDPIAYTYPNPASKNINLILRVEVEPVQHLKTRIYDLAGLLIRELEISSQYLKDMQRGKHIYELTIDSDDFTSGVYLGVISGQNLENQLVSNKYRFTVVK